MYFPSVTRLLFFAPALSVLADTPSFTTPIPSAPIGSCANNCLMTSARNSGCGSFDSSNFSCLCQPNNSFSNSTITCIQKTCNGADLQETAYILKKVCTEVSSSVAQSSTSTSTPTAIPPTNSNTKHVGGSAITTDIPASQGGDDSPSTSPTDSTPLPSQSSSSARNGDGTPTPLPPSASSGSGTRPATGASSSSTGAALGRTGLVQLQLPWTSLLLTSAGILIGAFCVLV